MYFLCRNVTNPLWLSSVYAAITTLQLLIFLILLRVNIATESRLHDLDRFFGMGSIVGVSFAWIGVAAGAELPILLVTSVSLSVFQCLMWWFGTAYLTEEDETKKGASESPLFIV